MQADPSVEADGTRLALGNAYNLRPGGKSVEAR